jgi:hypothetical protein
MPNHNDEWPKLPIGPEHLPLIRELMAEKEYADLLWRLEAGAAGANTVFIRLVLFRCFFLFRNSPSNLINIFFKILNQLAKWLILFGKPPSFKRNLGRFVVLKDLLL